MISLHFAARLSDLSTLRLRYRPPNCKKRRYFAGTVVEATFVHTDSVETSQDADQDDNKSWPGPHSDLLNDDPDWWLVACMDWPRDRWIGYVTGYRKAAALIVDNVAATGRDQDYLVYPFLMCWRHHIELQLKSLYLLLHRWHRSSAEPMRTHKIMTLWRKVRPLLKQMDSAEDPEITDVARILAQLEGFDPSSEHFRYPVLNDGSDTLETLGRIHLRGFHETMEDVAHYLDAVDTGLRVMIDDRDDCENDTALWSGE
ncbi:hypothetical protein G9U53_26215 [Rhodococcus sp. D-46]|uniref:hypothetical protein n=1 Tax=Rhodococcus sp. D-46 TaxID=2716265 RepID=UPI0013F608CA|nr:hypothetical protein [Rhodococcus sp. D-46]